MAKFEVNRTKKRRPIPPSPIKAPCAEEGCKEYAHYGYRLNAAPPVWRCEEHWKASPEGQKWAQERMMESLDLGSGVG